MPVLLTGDVLPFFTTVYAEDGETEVPAGSMRLVVTGPTVASSETYDPVVPTLGAGSYAIDHPAPTKGRYVGRWIATGNNAGSDMQVFNVDDESSFAPLVGLDEVKDHLQIPQDRMGDDEELWRVAASASALVEAETRLWHRATVVETLPACSGVLILSSGPVVSITSVVQGATTLDASSYRVDPYGMLRPAAGTWTAPWLTSGLYDDVVVTYEAGETVVPGPVREAVLLTVGDLWETQRGPAGLPLANLGQDENEAPPMPSDSLPPAAMAKLRPWSKGPVVA